MALNVNGRRPPGAAFDAMMHGDEGNQGQVVNSTPGQGGIRVTVYVIRRESFFQRAAGRSPFDPFQEEADSIPMSPEDLALTALLVAQARRGNGASFGNVRVCPAHPHQVIRVEPRGGSAALSAASGASLDEKQDGCCARVANACARAYNFLAKAWSGKQD